MRIPKRLQCRWCHRYCDLRTRGTVEVGHERFHIACELTPRSRRVTTYKHLTRAESLELFNCHWTQTRQQQPLKPWQR